MAYCNGHDKTQVQIWRLSEDEGSCSQRVAECLEKVKQAAESHRSDVLERSTSGTGEILRANFLLLLDAVLKQDHHLLDANELGFIETYRVSYCMSISSSACEPIPQVWHA